MTITEISKMSMVERLQTMEAIWDSLSHEIDEIKSPKWHEDELSSRRGKIEKGEGEFVSLHELKSKHRK